jgi:hypothetical protein
LGGGYDPNEDNLWEVGLCYRILRVTLSSSPSRNDCMPLPPALVARVTISFLFASIASLIWLLVRTGTKPSRIAYLCQRAAAAKVVILAEALPALFRGAIQQGLKSLVSVLPCHQSSDGRIVVVLVALNCVVSRGSGNRLWNRWPTPTRSTLPRPCSRLERSSAPRACHPQRWPFTGY